MRIAGMALLILLVVLLVLAVVCIARAIAVKNRELRPVPPRVDVQKAQKYAEDLSAMIQMDTVDELKQPEAEKIAKFEMFWEKLSQLFPKTFAVSERIDLQGPLLLRWKGRDEKRGAIILMAHADVVPATGEWKHDPFSGEIVDGCVWGRGAMDNKGSLCVLLEAVESLIKEGFTPPCDVYISSSNNEENSGDGAPKAATYLQTQGVKIDLVIDEGGAVIEEPLPGVKGVFAMIGIMEKGQGIVQFSAESAGGHSSTPPPNTPIARLADFVSDMEHHSPFQKKMTAPVKAMFQAIAPDLSFGLRLLAANLWLFSPVVVLLMSKISPMAAALFQTTCVFTMCEGSKAPNVIPNVASVTANLRYMLHQKKDDSLAILEERAKKYGLKMEHLSSSDCSPYVDMNSDMFHYVLRCVEEVYPEAGQVPYVMLGASDARHFAQICPCTIRFSPLRLAKQQLASMHAVDENIGIEALARGVDFYRQVLLQYS